VDSNGPVLLVTQEMAAPLPLRDTCPTVADFAAAILLAPPGFSDANKASVRFATGGGPVDWPELPEPLRKDFFEHPGARLLPFLAAIASPDTNEAPLRMSFPLSQRSSLMLSLAGAGQGAGLD
jgi:hypothetical protein